MEIKVKYTTEAEKADILILHADKILLETQNHEDGKALIFGDSPRPDKPPTIEDRLAILETAKADLEGRLVTMEAVKL